MCTLGGPAIYILCNPFDFGGRRHARRLFVSRGAQSPASGNICARNMTYDGRGICTDLYRLLTPLGDNRFTFERPFQPPRQQKQWTGAPCHLPANKYRGFPDLVARGRFTRRLALGRVLVARGRAPNSAVGRVLIVLSRCRGCLSVTTPIPQHPPSLAAPTAHSMRARSPARVGAPCARVTRPEARFESNQRAGARGVRGGA